jgi:TonB family protein
MPVALTLKVFKGEELIATREFDRDIIKIGRLSSAHLCLEDEKVSRIHSVIEVGADGALSIIDMGSVEGTWVNGKRVNKGALAFGDEIKVGGTTLRVEPATAAAAQNLAAAAVIGDVATTVVPAFDPQAALATDPVVATVGLAQAAAVAPEPVTPALAAPAPVWEEQPALPEAPLPVEPGAPAAAARPRHGRKKGSGPLGMELRFMWGDQMVGEFFMRPGTKVKPFTVGSARGVNFEMGDSKFGGPTFEAAKHVDGQGFVVRFSNKMKGEYLHKGDQMDLQQAIESGRASHDGDVYALAVGPDDFVTVDLGGIRMEACLQPVPKPIIIPFAEAIDFTVLNIFLVMFFLGALFVITAMNRNAEGDLYADELSSNQARIAKLIIKPPEVEKTNPLLERLNKQKEASGEMAAKHRGDEGKAGKRDAPERSARMAPKGDPNNKDQARMMMAKVFGGNSGGVSTIFGKSGLGGELKSAMGNLFGAAAGDAQGFGGLGLRGSGAGGGGVGDTIGIGGIGTKGRGGGMGKYGDGVGLGMGGKKGVDIGITSADPVVMGSLDKELIRKVIRSNIGQIRYCYENRLTQKPNLHGKVAVRFVITATGSVAQSSVVDTTAGDAALETCVAGRVRTWQFPKPKGGGVVVVTYPFIFKKAGE